jgi:hypothetical protein
VCNVWGVLLTIELERLKQGHGGTMYQLCINIGGTRHCFPLPSLIDPIHIHVPPPNNYPPFELAIAVLQLVNVVPESELSKELSQVATRFIHQVQKQLPQGTEIIAQERAAKKAA